MTVKPQYTIAFHTAFVTLSRTLLREMCFETSSIRSSISRPRVWLNQTSVVFISYKEV